jgi:anthranilate phosphoribosyltransferase
MVVAGLASNWGEGLELALAVIDDGRAARVLDRLVAVSQEAVREERS